MSTFRIAEKWCQFVNTRNIPELISLYAKNSILMPSFGNEIITGRENIKDYFYMTDEREVKFLSFNQREGMKNVINGEYSFISKNKKYKAEYTMVLSMEEKNKIVCHHSLLLPFEKTLDMHRYLRRYTEMKI